MWIILGHLVSKCATLNIIVWENIWYAGVMSLGMIKYFFTVRWEFLSKRSPTVSHKFMRITLIRVSC